MNACGDGGRAETVEGGVKKKVKVSRCGARKIVWTINKFGRGQA